MKFCIECGEKIPDNAKFCYHCGTKLELTQADNMASDALSLDFEETSPNGGYAEEKSVMPKNDSGSESIKHTVSPDTDASIRTKVKNNTKLVAEDTDEDMEEGTEYMEPAEEYEEEDTEEEEYYEEDSPSKEQSDLSMADGEEEPASSNVLSGLSVAATIEKDPEESQPVGILKPKNPATDPYWDDVLPEVENEYNQIPKDIILKAAGCIVALFAVIAWLIYTL